MTKLNNPHDKFIKRMMAEKRVAEDFFRQHLPRRIHRLMRFDMLELCKESFIDDHLRLSSADMLFETRFVGNTPGYLYPIG